MFYSKLSQKPLFISALLFQISINVFTHVNGGIIRREISNENETLPEITTNLSFRSQVTKSPSNETLINSTAQDFRNNSNNYNIEYTTVRETRSESVLTTKRVGTTTRRKPITTTLETTTFSPETQNSFTNLNRNTNTSKTKDNKISLDITSTETTSNKDTTTEFSEDGATEQDIFRDLFNFNFESTTSESIEKETENFDKIMTSTVNDMETKPSSMANLKENISKTISEINQNESEHSTKNESSHKSLKQDIKLTQAERTTISTTIPQKNNEGKNYDIVTNEIKNSSNISSTDKRAKFMKENSTSSNDLIIPNAAEIWALASMKDKSFKEKLIRLDNNNNKTNSSTILFPSENSNVEKNNGTMKLLTDWSEIMKNIDTDNSSLSSSSSSTIETITSSKGLNERFDNDNQVISVISEQPLRYDLKNVTTTPTVKTILLNDSSETLTEKIPLNVYRINNDHVLEKNVLENENSETILNINASSVNDNNNHLDVNGNDFKSNQVKLKSTAETIKSSTSTNLFQVESKNNSNAQLKKEDIIELNTLTLNILKNNSTEKYYETFENNLSQTTTSDSNLDAISFISTTEENGLTTNNINLSEIRTSTTKKPSEIIETNQTTKDTPTTVSGNFESESTTQEMDLISTTEINLKYILKETSPITESEETSIAETSSSIPITDGPIFSKVTTSEKPSSTEKIIEQTGPETSIETNTIDKIKATTQSHTISKMVSTSTENSTIENQGEAIDNNVDTLSSTDSIKNQQQPLETTTVFLNNFEMFTSDPKINVTVTTEKNCGSSSSPNVEELDTSSGETDYNVIIAVSVSVVGIIALILLVGFLYVMRKRQKQLTYGQRCRPVSLDAYSLDNISVHNSVRRKGGIRASKRSYGNVAFDDPALKHNNMGIHELAKFVDRKTAIYEEFKDMPQITAKADEVPQGCEDKNRYANVIPLPETRVILQQQNEDEKTEYINANYVRGPKDSPNYYIACQAPLECTVPDFWRMIWEQNSRVIIMATDLIENGIEKCAEYLPASITLDNHVTYGDYQITLKNREVKEKYAVSTLHVKHLKTNAWREITHFWYQWPITGVPADEAAMIAMLLEARSCLKMSLNEQIDDDNESDKSATQINGNSTNGEPKGNVQKSKSIQKTQGPLTVHCSPGTGRTGTIIACDIALRSLEAPKRSVDIPQIVYYVRRGRASAVQTKEQYEFIYKITHMYATKISGFWLSFFFICILASWLVTNSALTVSWNILFKSMPDGRVESQITLGDMNKTEYILIIKTFVINTF